MTLINEQKKTDLVSQHQSSWTDSDMSYYSGGFGFGGYDLHSHRHEEFKIGNYTVWLTGSRAIPIKEEHLYTPKEVAIYLDPMSWAGIRKFRSADTVSVLPKPIATEQGEIQYVRWPDMNSIEMNLFRELIKRTRAYIESGKEVEIGCIGAHGRTGTLLAGLLVNMQNLKAEAAMDKVKEDYCDRAIETYKQEGMIYALTGEKQPAPKYTTYTGSGAYSYKSGTEYAASDRAMWGSPPAIAYTFSERMRQRIDIALLRPIRKLLARGKSASIDDKYVDVEAIYREILAEAEAEQAEETTPKDKPIDRSVYDDEFNDYQNEEWWDDVFGKETTQESGDKVAEEFAFNEETGEIEPAGSYEEVKVDKLDPKVLYFMGETSISKEVYESVKKIGGLGSDMLRVEMEWE